MYLKFFLIASVLRGALAVCPPAALIIPCRCDEAQLRWYCNNQQYPELWDIKATFDAISPLVPHDFVFEQILITVTNLVTIPADAIKTIKFKKIYFEYNYELKYIHPDAFGETANVTTYLSFLYNKILSNEGEGHTDRDLFDVLSRFTAATEIQISTNNISRIPDNGFGPLPNLKVFKLGPWSPGVTRIGNRAFTQLPNLTTISLQTCEIDEDDIAEDAFDGVEPNVEVLLQYNPFRKMPEVPFKKMLENVRVVFVGGYQNDYSMDCDETSAWLCEDVEKYKPKLNGFLCTRAVGLVDIWAYCEREGQRERNQTYVY